MSDHLPLIAEFDLSLRMPLIPPQIAPGHDFACARRSSIFPRFVAAIDASLREVRLETYIFHFDASGEKVAAALVRPQRGVWRSTW
jgi:hypothetical protein